MDVFNRDKRQEIMSRVKNKNTKPELYVRKLIHVLGYRYRLHRKDLPGNPDLVFPGRKKVIFIHGCFWHQHNCKKATRPETNKDFWNKKLDTTLRRDKRNINRLKESGWDVLIIWECEIKNEQLVEQITDFLAG